MKYYADYYESPIGKLMLAAGEQGLAGIWIEGQKYFADSLKEQSMIWEDHALLQPAKDWLDRYFAGEKPRAEEIALAPLGGAFRQAVWRILCRIPYGQTMTYGQIAKEIALQLQRPGMSAQAVGGAVGHNPISILIPCHRVMGANGSLTGYAGGIDKKIWLLQHEGVDLSHFTIPKKGTAL